MALPIFVELRHPIQLRQSFPFLLAFEKTIANFTKYATAAPFKVENNANIFLASQKEKEKRERKKSMQSLRFEAPSSYRSKECKVQRGGRPSSQIFINHEASLLFLASYQLNNAGHPQLLLLLIMVSVKARGAPRSRPKLQ